MANIKLDSSFSTQTKTIPFHCRINFQRVSIDSYTSLTQPHAKTISKLAIKRMIKNYNTI